LGNWLKVGVPVIAVAILSITVVSILAEEELIPSWIRNIAGFWADRQISDKEFLSALQYLVEQGILVIPPTEDSAKIVKEVTKEPTESEEPKRITERIDGEIAFDKIEQMIEFSKGVNKEMAESIIFKDASESEFLLGIAADTEWQGIIVDGSAMRSIHGGGTSALIPFSCDYVGIWMYNLNIQKQTEEGTIIVMVFKDDFQINSSITDAPFGIVSLDGNCEGLN